MARYLIVAGVDFGTSFTKVVLRDNNTPGSRTVVVKFTSYLNGLLPSLVGIDGEWLIPPVSIGEMSKVPYPKMIAAHVASGESLEQIPVRVPEAFLKLVHHFHSVHTLVRNLLAFYFAHVMAATEHFIGNHSPWRNFNFEAGNTEDYLIFQLAVPSGLLLDHGKTEQFFREAFIAGHELRKQADPAMAKPVLYPSWAEQVENVVNCDQPSLDARYQWQCLLYPEVAAAVQTVFQSPNARDGLYITMDVGAGTVDLNAFRRFTPAGKKPQLDYYSAIVCPLGIQNLHDPYHSVVPQNERELMKKLRAKLQELYFKAKDLQPNHGKTPGSRTWDESTLFIFGGGCHHDGYRENFTEGLENLGFYNPYVYDLPSSKDISCPKDVEFGRFAVAYGMSFFRAKLDQVRLPFELTPFRELCQPVENEPPREYGFNWDD